MVPETNGTPPPPAFDPKAFSRAPPERVCQMVQDLFTALLAIKDGDAQDRLLVETLRHVMAG